MSCAAVSRGYLGSGPAATALAPEPPTAFSPYTRIAGLEEPDYVTDEPGIDVALTIKLDFEEAMDNDDLAWNLRVLHPRYDDDALPAHSMGIAEEYLEAA
jgi:hypothetical protein